MGEAMPDQGTDRQSKPFSCRASGRFDYRLCDMQSRQHRHVDNTNNPPPTHKQSTRSGRASGETRWEVSTAGNPQHFTIPWV
ncbi:hypothetical protein BaRGS_00007695 [Batillaria attramentaria]|uniref:Uncharacterized protein n=1 Tax=Batillaria attramentaria TaxID=370345 RepID=A0ABD0LPR7_9CAEN